MYIYFPLHREQILRHSEKLEHLKQNYVNQLTKALHDEKKVSPQSPEVRTDMECVFNAVRIILMYLSHLVNKNVYSDFLLGGETNKSCSSMCEYTQARVSVCTI